MAILDRQESILEVASKDAKRRHLEELLAMLGVTDADLNLPSSEFQRQFGPVLRQMSLDLISDEKSEIFHNLTASFKAEGYSEEQAKEKVEALVIKNSGSAWANNAVIAAGAEVLNITLDVTDTNTASRKQPTQEYNLRRSNRTGAVEVRVYVKDNTHFSDTTNGAGVVGNGQCFENSVVSSLQKQAVALGLQKEVVIEKSDAIVASFDVDTNVAKSVEVDSAEAAFQDAYYNRYSDEQKSLYDLDCALARRLALGDTSAELELVNNHDAYFGEDTGRNRLFDEDRFGASDSAILIPAKA